MDRVISLNTEPTTSPSHLCALNDFASECLDFFMTTVSEEAF